jgi:carboxymethylenebutenolidase
MHTHAEALRPLLLLVVLASGLAADAVRAAADAFDPEIVHFPNQSEILGGEVFKPKGSGPFPAVLYNHGSAPGMLNSQASASIGPLFAAKGWVFFMPYRRGQGLSAQAGRFIGDEVADARKRGGLAEGAATLSRLLSTDHLQDQLAALRWLKAQSFVQPNRVAVAGNSFGGIESVLGAANASYCAAVDASGGAESWELAPELREIMKAAVRRSNSPILFFQAENDFSLSPSQALLAEMKQAGKVGEIRIYPPFGSTAREGHSFAYLGASKWFPDVFAFIQKHCMP